MKENHPSCIQLDLEDCLIGDYEAIQIATALRKNETVEIMSLTKNLITDKGLDHLFLQL